MLGVSKETLNKIAGVSFPGWENYERHIGTDVTIIAFAKPMHSRLPLFKNAKPVSEDTATNEVQPSQMRLYWLLWCLVVGVLLIPIWTTRYLPLVDYPHALARGYIAAHYDDVASFQQIYERPLAVVPNLGFEAIAKVAGRVMNIELIGRLTWTLTIGLFALGCHLISVTFFGKPLWTSLLAIFFIYSTHLFYGNINFLLGLALFLILFAVWRRLFVDRPWLSAILLLLGTPINFLIHLGTYAFEATAIGISLLFALRSNKISYLRAVGQVAPVAATLLLFKLFLTHGGTVGQIAFNGPIEKLLETASLISTYRHSWDAVYVILLLVTVIFVVRKKSSLYFQPEALTIGCAFYLFLWLCPGTLFTSSGADVRFLVPAFVFGLLSVRFVMEKRTLQYCIGFLILLGSVRIVLIDVDWHSLSDRIAPQIALWQELPAGASAYPLYYRDSLAVRPDGKLLPVIGLYGILNRQIYNPIFYAFREQHPIVFRTLPDFKPLNTAHDLTQSFAATQLLHYDYIWCYRISQEGLTNLKKSGHAIDSADGAILMKMDAFK